MPFDIVETDLFWSSLENNTNNGKINFTDQTLKNYVFGYLPEHNTISTPDNVIVFDSSTYNSDGNNIKFFDIVTNFGFNIKIAPTHTILTDSTIPRIGSLDATESLISQVLTNYNVMIDDICTTLSTMVLYDNNSNQLTTITTGDTIQIPINVQFYYNNAVADNIVLVLSITKTAQGT